MIVRKGKEQTKTVKLGRLEDGDQKRAAATPSKRRRAGGEDRSCRRRSGSTSPTCRDELRKKYKIKDSVKGVVDHRRRRGHRRRPRSGCTPATSIVEVAQEAVATAADVQKRIDQLKKDGRKAALLLVRTRKANCASWR